MEPIFNSVEEARKCKKLCELFRRRKWLIEKGIKVERYGEDIKFSIVKVKEESLINKFINWLGV